MDKEQITLHKYLVVQSRKGDRKAQFELYKLFSVAMYNICRRMMGNEDAAKDVLQDAFIEAFSKLSSLREEKLFAGWLKRIVMNHCLNALKKKSLITTDLEQAPEPIEEYGNDEDIQYKANQVMKAIKLISEGCRVIVNLYLFEGYNHKEIAEVLGISESASKAQYSKGKAKIRRLIELRTV